MIDTRRPLPGNVEDTLDRGAPDPLDRDAQVAATARAWPQPGEDATDLTILNANAAELNVEAEDALAYQVPL